MLHSLTGFMCDHRLHSVAGLMCDPGSRSSNGVMRYLGLHPSSDVVFVIAYSGTVCNCVLGAGLHHCIAYCIPSVIQGGGGLGDQSRDFTVLRMLFSAVR